MARKKTTKKNTNRKPKRKNKSQIPPSLIVGGIFLLMVGLIVISLLSIKLRDMEKQRADTNTNRQSQDTGQYSISDIDRQIKLFLYDHEISKRNIVSKYINFEKDSQHIHYTIEVDKQKIYPMRKSLINFFNSKDFSFTEKQSMIFRKNNFIVSINLTESKKETYSKDKTGTKKKDRVKQKPITDKIQYEAKMAIILDDAGYNLALAEKAVSIKYPLTLSILPYTEYDRETAEITRKNNKGVFLHLPMQPLSYPDTDPGKGAILLNTPESLIKILIEKDIEQLGKIDGANNHMGSAVTENSKKIKQTLQYLKNYTNSFVDSHTSKNSVAFDVCRSLGMNCGISEKFIDNSADTEYIKEKLQEGAQLALKNKKIIIIGHLRPNTVDVLKNILPEIEKKGVQIVPVSEVLKN